MVSQFLVVPYCASDYIVIVRFRGFFVEVLEVEVGAFGDLRNGEVELCQCILCLISDQLRVHNSGVGNRESTPTWNR